MAVISGQVSSCSIASAQLVHELEGPAHVGDDIGLGDLETDAMRVDRESVLQVLGREFQIRVVQRLSGQVDGENAFVLWAVPPEVGYLRERRAAETAVTVTYRGSFLGHRDGGAIAAYHDGGRGVQCMSPAGTHRPIFR